MSLMIHKNTRYTFDLLHNLCHAHHHTWITAIDMMHPVMVLLLCLLLLCDRISGGFRRCRCLCRSDALSSSTVFVPGAPCDKFNLKKGTNEQDSDWYYDSDKIVSKVHFLAHGQGSSRKERQAARWRVVLVKL